MSQELPYQRIHVRGSGGRLSQFNPRAYLSVGASVGHGVRIVAGGARFTVVSAHDVVWDLKRLEVGVGVDVCVDVEEFKVEKVVDGAGEMEGSRGRRGC